MKHKKFVDIALQIARSNDNFRTKIAAIVIYQNRIVGVGVNDKKTDPLQARFGKNIHSIWIHAEIAAIKNSLRTINLEQLKKSTIIVTRMRRDGFVGLAKPCSGCMRAIISFGFQRLIYTKDDGDFVIVDL
jgi:tRNA(Arg) A34 adenosine deaminase TadA